MKTRIKTMLLALIFSFSLIFSSTVHAESHCFSLSGGYADENNITTVTASIEPAIVAAAFSVSFYFDPSMLEFVDASFSEDYGNFYFGDSAEDCATIVWSDSKNRTLENELFTIRFKTKSDTAGCTAPIDVGYTTFGNTITEEIVVDTKGCEIIIASEYMWGDANCDRTVSISDAVVITLFSVNQKKYPLSEIQLANSDTDGNDIVDSKDASKVINHIIKS